MSSITHGVQTGTSTIHSTERNIKYNKYNTTYPEYNTPYTDYRTTFSESNEYENYNTTYTDFGTTYALYNSTQAGYNTSFAQNITNSTEGYIDLELFRRLLEDEFDPTFPLGQVQSILIVILYCPFFVFGILLNSVIIYVIVKRPQLRSITNLFLVSLALADLSVTLICIPMAVGQALYKIWLYGEFMCKLTGFLQSVTVAASVFTIALLSIDRFLAIRHPMIFRRVSTSRVAGRLIICVWVMAVVLMIPLLVVRQILVFDILPTDPVHVCVELWPHESMRQHYDISLLIIVYIVPGTVVGVSYGMIGSELWTEDTNLKRTESETSRGLGKQMMQGRKRVAKMLIALAVLFAVCWLPYHSVTIYLDFNPRDKQMLLVLPYTIFLGHANSALNPILYFYSSKSFRRFLLRMLHCKKRQHKPARRENLIVRCTRNAATTTTALTRRPFIRILSSSSLTSRSGSVKFSRSSGSLKFSRSSNTSLRSSSNSNRSSKRNVDQTSPRANKDRKFDYPAIAVQEPTYNGYNGYTDPLMDAAENHLYLPAIGLKHKRPIMECTISVPTTINEESSRRGSVTPSRPAPELSLCEVKQEPIREEIIDPEVSDLTKEHDVTECLCKDTFSEEPDHTTEDVNTIHKTTDEFNDSAVLNDLKDDCNLPSAQVEDKETVVVQ